MNHCSISGFYQNYLLYILAIIFLACEGVTPPEYDIVPETTLLASDSLYTSSSVTLNWTGNEYAYQYRYMLEYTGYASDIVAHVLFADWSEWAKDTSVTFNYLDEGYYSFHVTSRSDSLTIEAETTVFNFQVNAVQGPALRMYPMKQKVLGDGIFHIELYAEEIASISAISDMAVYLGYDSHLLTYSGFVKGAILEGYDLILFPPVSNENSHILIEGGVSNPGISGTGPIGKLTFVNSGLVGSTMISIVDSTFYRMSSGEIKFSFDTRVSGIIEVGP